MSFDTINHSACYAKSILRFIMLYATLFQISASFAVTNVNNQLFGIKFISYNNFDGALANGHCCDEQDKEAGHCSPDMCDTAFYPCGTTNVKEECNLWQYQQSPVTFNNNSFNFGKWIGNGVNKSASFIVFKFPFIQKNIDFAITAVETPEEGIIGGYQDIAKFQFLVDWVDPIFLNPPKFRRQVLNDTRAQLVVDVVSQCSKYYYTNDCSVYCKPDKEHFICLDNGTVQCLPGWSGTNCLTMIDYCPGNKCQHNSRCVPILQDYACICTHGFTGHFCETRTTGAATAGDNITRETTGETLGSTTAETIADTSAETNTESNRKTNTETNTNTTLKTSSAPMASHTAAIFEINDQGERSKSKSSSSGDNDNAAGTAAGVTVGVLLLGTVAVLLVYFIIKKKKRMSQVAPEGKPPLDTELTTERRMETNVVGHDESKVPIENNPPLDTELTSNRRMDAFVVGHDESPTEDNPSLDTELMRKTRIEAYVIGHDE